MKASKALIIGAALLGLIGLGVWYGQRPSEPGQAVAPEPGPPVMPIAAAPAEPASAPLIAHPLELPASAAADEAELEVSDVLTQLFGRKSVRTLFQVQDFPRRFVATVDNLGRAQAPKSLWPLNPASGRFTVQVLDSGSVISLDNGLRYAPYVQLIEGVDMRQLAALYTRLYPLFQHAYEEIGFPKHYFNDRLVKVIDLMLDTPEPQVPIKVRMPTMAAPVQLKHPWMFYVFDDPALQSLSAGQKIMLRMGVINQRRIKAKLVEFRRLIAVPQAR